MSKQSFLNYTTIHVYISFQFLRLLKETTELVKVKFKTSNLLVDWFIHISNGFYQLLVLFLNIQACNDSYGICKYNFDTSGNLEVFNIICKRNCKTKNIVNFKEFRPFQKERFILKRKDVVWNGLKFIMYLVLPFLLQIQFWITRTSCGIVQNVLSTGWH